MFFLAMMIVIGMNNVELGRNGDGNTATDRKLPSAEIFFAISR